MHGEMSDRGEAERIETYSNFFQGIAFHWIREIFFGIFEPRVESRRFLREP